MNNTSTRAERHYWIDMQMQKRWPLTGDPHILQAKLDRNEGALYALTGIEDGIHVEEVYDIIAELRARLAETEAENRKLHRLRDVVTRITTETFTHETINGKAYIRLNQWFYCIKRLQDALWESRE